MFSISPVRVVYIIFCHVVKTEVSFLYLFTVLISNDFRIGSGIPFFTARRNYILFFRIVFSILSLQFIVLFNAVLESCGYSTSPHFRRGLCVLYKITLFRGVSVCQLYKITLFQKAKQPIA